jgi:hypothetical protein
MGGSPSPNPANSATKPYSQIITATPQDIHAIAALENLVFYDEPFSTVAFGPTRDSPENIALRAAQLGSKAWPGMKKVHFKAVDEKGEIVGAAEWRFIDVEEKRRHDEEERRQNESKIAEAKSGSNNEKPEVDNSWGFGANVGRLSAVRVRGSYTDQATGQIL